MNTVYRLTWLQVGLYPSAYCGEKKCRIVAQTCAPGVSVSWAGRRCDVDANPIIKRRRNPRRELSAGTDAGRESRPT